MTETLRALRSYFTGTRDTTPTRSLMPTAPRYRADIDGLRALSILLVVAFHLETRAFTGGYVGVDVFFVISGFLITGILIREASERRSVDLSRFYGWRARRLLPLSAIALLCTIAVGFLLLPPIDFGGLLGDIRAAALYVSNWRFAGQATTYSAANPSTSLVVHYWSLSIEEQFYLVWPLLMIIVARVAARRRPERLVRRLTIVLGAGAVASYVLSIWLTRTYGASMYYATYIRFGELAAGGMLALAAHRGIRMPRPLAEVGAVVGFLAILVAAWFLSGATAFPGWVVAVPVLGGSLVLGTGTAHETSVARLLGRKPLPAIGRISYGWYLWHWPVIGAAILLTRRMSGTMQIAGKAGAVVGSFVLAAITARLIENRFRYSKWLAASSKRSLVLGGALTLVVVAATFTPTSAAERVRAMRLGERGHLAMTPEQARNDISPETNRCQDAYTTTTAPADCVFGAKHGRQTIVLTGDSHARHWFPAFDIAARRMNARLYLWTKVSCSPMDVRITNGPLMREYTECATWRRNVLARISRLHRVDLVVLASTNYITDVVGAETPAQRAKATSLWTEGAGRTFTSLLRRTKHVLVMRDTPRAPFDVPSCLSAAADVASKCTFPVRKAVHRDKATIRADRAAAPAGVSFADLTAELCPVHPCPSVTRRGVIIYRDQGHMTATFNRTLVPQVTGLIRSALVSS